MINHMELFRHLHKMLKKEFCRIHHYDTMGFKSLLIPPTLCVEMGFTWTFPRNQDATVKLKSELISIKYYC